MLIRKLDRMKTHCPGSRLIICALLALTITFLSPGLGILFAESALIASQASKQNGSPIDWEQISPSCLTNTQLINTGYNDSTNSTYPIAATDPNWVVIKDPDSSTTESRDAFVVSQYPGWKPPLSNS